MSTEIEEPFIPSTNPPFYVRYGKFIIPPLTFITLLLTVTLFVESWTYSPGSYYLYNEHNNVTNYSGFLERYYGIYYVKSGDNMFSTWAEMSGEACSRLFIYLIGTDGDTSPFAPNCDVQGFTDSEKCAKEFSLALSGRCSNYQNLQILNNTIAMALLIVIICQSMQFIIIMIKRIGLSNILQYIFFTSMSWFIFVLTLLSFLAYLPLTIVFISEIKKTSNFPAISVGLGYIQLGVVVILNCIIAIYYQKHRLTYFIDDVDDSDDEEEEEEVD